MPNNALDLDQMQTAYKVAVEEWIAAIKQEEALASVNHSIAEVDRWEQAHFKEDDIRSKVKAAKKRYEDALREKFFGNEQALERILKFLPEAKPVVPQIAGIPVSLR